MSDVTARSNCTPEQGQEAEKGVGRRTLESTGGNENHVCDQRYRLIPTSTIPAAHL